MIYAALHPVYAPQRMSLTANRVPVRMHSHLNDLCQPLIFPFDWGKRQG